MVQDFRYLHLFTLNADAIHFKRHATNDFKMYERHAATSTIFVSTVR